jgi:hypothetical protein
MTFFSALSNTHCEALSMQPEHGTTPEHLIFFVRHLPQLKVVNGPYP